MTNLERTKKGDKFTYMRNKVIAFLDYSNEATSLIFTESKPRTIEDGLKEGDLIENPEAKRKVLGVCGNIVFISYGNNYNKYGYPSTVNELYDSGYRLVQPE